jgi:hypothetical protein
VDVHQLASGLIGGLHLAVLGGLHLGLHIGVGAVMTQIGLGHSLASTVFLPSDWTYGMTLAAHVDLPTLVRIAGRPLALGLYAGAIAPARRDQTIGLEEGASAITYGGQVGATLLFALYKSLGLRFAYDYEIFSTAFAGPGRRDPTSTVAHLDSSGHVATLGLVFSAR